MRAQGTEWRRARSRERDHESTRVARVAQAVERGAGGWERGLAGSWRRRETPPKKKEVDVLGDDKRGGEHISL